MEYDHLTSFLSRTGPHRSWRFARPRQSLHLETRWLIPTSLSTADPTGSTVTLAPIADTPTGRPGTGPGAARRRRPRSARDSVRDDHWLRPWVRRERLGLSPSLASVLYLIRDEATPTLRSLADRLDVTPTAITSITDRLETLGYVRRVRTSLDRRRTQLEITEAGREISFQIEQSFVDDIQGILSSWDDERLDELQQSAQALTTFLQEVNATGVHQGR